MSDKDLEGKVALITGAARGQGRSHAVRLAAAGADIAVLDVCAQIDTVPYPLATKADLDETVAEVEALGRRVRAFTTDVRDLGAMRAVVTSVVAELGSLDIVVANAGIGAMRLDPLEEEWGDVIDVNLTGVYNTVRASVPPMISRGAGGAIVLTSSTAGLSGVGGNTPGGLAYTASKHGVVGLMRAFANYLAAHSIRVNSVHPTGVRTPMIENEYMQEYLRSDATLSQEMTNALPVDAVEAEDVASAVHWLVSDGARYVTGVALPVDGGFTNKK